MAISDEKYCDAFQPDDEVVMKVTEIAMGSNHMLALGHDRLTRVSDGSSSDQLQYAEHILAPMKRYLVRRGIEIFRRRFPTLQYIAG